MRAREPTSFSRENVVAVVTLLRLLVRTLQCRIVNKLSNDRRFIVLRSGEGLTAFTKDKSANFSGESKVQ